VRYGVIGAGVLGLTAALRLAERGHAVTVLERDPTPGGLAGSFEVAPGTWLEKFYHHLFRTDRRAIALVEELGLGPDLRWHRPVTSVFAGGRVHQLDSPASVLAFDPLMIPDRLRLAAGLAYLRILPSHRSLERATASRWLPRLMGGGAYRTVWEPLLRGKFGPAAPEISMAWLWARIHCRTASLGYLQGGFHRLYDALATRVVARGGTIRYGAAAGGIFRVEAGLVVRLAAGESSEELGFDRVVSTLPTGLTVQLTPEMPADYAARHPAPRALGAHCLVLSLDRQLTDVYWVGVNDRDMPFLALVEHTNMVPPEEYGGRHLVYLGNYRAHDDPIFGRSTEALVVDAEAGIQRINPSFRRTWIQDAWSFAAPFAQPIVTPAFARTIPGFDTPVPGLYVANMFQVYPWDRGQNYSIQLAERLVQHLEAA
jgi:protoporphyrinogen oxidase